MASKILQLLAISTLAIIASSYGTTPVTALSVDSRHVVRHVPNSHSGIAKRKRSNNRRCKPRPSSSKAPVSSATPAPSNNNNGGSNNGNNNGSGNNSPAPAPASSKAPTTPKPSPTPSNNNNNGNSGSSGNNNGGGGGGSGNSVGGAKVGLAWPNGNDPSLKNFVNSHVQYVYTWSPYYPNDAKKLGLKPMPMLWGDKQIGDFTRLVKPGYADIVLGMNEPNQKGQAQMSPEHGFDLWMKYINPLKDQGYYLISPACTNAPDGLTWMKTFIGLCNKNSECRIDGVAVHYYGTSSSDFIQHLNTYHDAFGKDVWATEFACQDFSGNNRQCNKGQVHDFMGAVTGFMDSQSWVKGYFAFGVMHDMVDVNPLNQLMAGDGRPTDLGYQYIKA
ncbi:hypothetical protein ONZ45_g12 [Pleurotus djamor]|nr:hypothetical protein ONZ45_g12 [Pleurotus djamor]